MQSAIEAYATELYSRELEYQRENAPERLDRLLAENPNALDEFRERLVREAAEIATLMQSPEAYAPKLAAGALHPSNGCTRKLFTAITGIALPSTVSGTEEALAATPYGAALRELREQRQQERDRQEAEKAERQRSAEANRLAEIESRILADEEISGEELLSACRHNGIEVHPRTAGFWKARIVGIRSDSGRIRRTKGQSTDATSAHNAYRELRERLQSRPAPSPVHPFRVGQRVQAAGGFNLNGTPKPDKIGTVVDATPGLWPSVQFVGARAPETVYPGALALAAEFASEALDYLPA